MPGRSSRSCYQFFLPTTSLSRHVATCTALVCSETWLLTKPNLQFLQWYDRTMIRQICNVKLQDIFTIRSYELIVQLCIEDGPHPEGQKTPLVRTHEMLQQSSQVSLKYTGWWKAWALETQDDMEAADREGSQRVEVTGYQPSWYTWRSGVRSAMVQQASYLERGPLMWMLPLYLQGIQKSGDYDHEEMPGPIFCEKYFKMPIAGLFNLES